MDEIMARKEPLLAPSNWQINNVRGVLRHGADGKRHCQQLELIANYKIDIDILPYSASNG